MVEPTTRPDQTVMRAGVAKMATMVIIVIFKVVTMVKGVPRIEIDNLEASLTKIRGNATGFMAVDTSESNAPVLGLQDLKSRGARPDSPQRQTTTILRYLPRSNKD